MSFMSCLETCVGHMMELSLTDELCISHMSSLPSAVIQTIKTTFKHCKVCTYDIIMLCSVVTKDVIGGRFLRTFGGISAQA